MSPNQKRQGISASRPPVVFSVPPAQPALAPATAGTSGLTFDTRHYALKKRLLLPVWLLEGVLLALGTKEPWFEAIAQPRLGNVFASPSALPVRALVPFFLIWNELIQRLFQPVETEQEHVLKFHVSKYISGTKKDILEKSKEIESIFSSPLKLFKIKPSRKTQALSVSKQGSLNFIRHAQLETDVDGVWLTLHFIHGVRDVCCPSELKDHILNQDAHIISINPVVIQSMGTRASLKKILGYLFVEFSKQERSFCHDPWQSFPVNCKKISVFHKDFLTAAPTFYDHGVLGWTNSAPPQRISDIKQQQAFLGLACDVLCSWQLSEHVKEAFIIEQGISQKLLQKTDHLVDVATPFNLTAAQPKASLFPEPPADELKKAREEKKLQAGEGGYIHKRARKSTRSSTKSATTTQQTIPKKVIVQKLFDDGIINQKKTAQQPVHELSDREFLILVSEFYESLKPLQKKAFRRVQEGMSSEQFRAYMSSILQRRQSGHPVL